MHVAGWLTPKWKARHPTRGNKVEFTFSQRQGNVGTLTPSRGHNRLWLAGRVIKHAQLVEGEAFRQDVLEQAQDNIADYAQGQGFYTFNTSHVSYVVDTECRIHPWIDTQVVCHLGVQPHYRPLRLRNRGAGTCENIPRFILETSRVESPNGNRRGPVA